MYLFCLYMNVCKYKSASVEVREQAVRVISLFPPWGFWELNEDKQEHTFNHWAILPTLDLNL